VRMPMVVFLSMLVSGCVSPAPGADKVRLTKNAGDVASCSAVGNVKVAPGPNGTVDIATAGVEFRNQVVGYGGNTAYLTSDPLGVPVEGVAYRCP
jgi:hypothetical protein